MAILKDFSFGQKHYFYLMSSLQKPILNKRIFWDVNFDALDYNSRSSFIIERVFERGDVEDIRQVRRFYGDERVKEVLLNSKYLPERRLHLAAAVIDKPITQFRCSISRLSNPGLFPY